jgi:hypothetical protein
MDLLWSKEGSGIIRKMILTSPATLSNFFNKQLYGIVDGKGYVVDGISSEESPLLLIHGRNGNFVDWQPLIQNLRTQGVSLSGIWNNNWS